MVEQIKVYSRTILTEKKMNMYFLNNIAAWQNKKAELDLTDYVSTKYFTQTK